jgi:hypothetical protein
MLGVAVSADILRTNLITLSVVVLITLSVDIREVMEHMSGLPTQQTQIPPGTITTARKGM